jgi:hypothetical protein
VVASEHAGRLHRGAARQIRSREGEAVVERAAGVADPEPEVPEGVEDLLRHPLDVGADLAAVDEHEIEVGGGCSPRPYPRARPGPGAKAGSAAHLGVGGLVEPPEEVVHERGVRPNTLGPRRPVRVPGPEALVRGGDVLAEHVESRTPAALGPLRLRAGEVLPHRRFRAAQAPHQRLSHRENDASMGGRECQTRATIGAVTIDSLTAGLV